jgi:hypothetical protein
MESLSNHVNGRGDQSPGDGLLLGGRSDGDWLLTPFDRFLVSRPAP